MLGGVVASRPNPGPGVGRDRDSGDGNGLGPDAPLAGAPRPAALPVGAKAVHFATLIFAFGAWVALDRHLWFYGDEWDFLTRRGLHGAFFSLWAPHNEHWSVLPILLWRALYSVFHLSTYLPYLLPVLLAHVAIVHLVWRRCLKQGADPWLATALAAVLALFGPGAEDLTWAFQIGFLGSLALGLLAWEVAELPLPAAPRWAVDVGVAALALASVMCSTVGLATTAGLAVVIGGRHGWRRATRVLAVPVLAYIVWFVLSGHQGVTGTGDTLQPDVFAKTPLFIVWNLADALGSTVAVALSGPFFLAAVAVWLWPRRRDLYRSQTGLLACLVSAVTFYGLAALGRDRISVAMSPSRYTYIGAALLLPVFAAMLSRYSARQATWARPARAVLLSGVAVAAVVNFAGGVNFARGRATYVDGLKAQIVTTGALLQERARRERAVNPFPFKGSGNRAGYLTDDLVASLYRQHLLGAVAITSISARQLEVDESWLDITARSRPFYPNRFHVAVAGGFRLYRWAAAPDAVTDEPGWAIMPAGGPEVPAVGSAVPVGAPPDCALAMPTSALTEAGHLGRGWLRLAPASAHDRGSVWLSLGGGGGHLYVSLAHSWAPGGRWGHLSAYPSPTVPGEQLALRPGGHLWVSGSVAGDGLIVRAQVSASFEICGLAFAPRPGNYATKL